MSDEEREEKRGFKVEDRRRFSESGEAREGHGHPEPEPTPSTPPPSAAAQPPPPADAPHASAQFDINFSTFVISLSTQALAHLGEIPHPIDNQTIVDLGAAKQLIDILGILKDKTQGNLDPQEATLLDHALYDLRLKYVEHVRRS